MSTARMRQLSVAAGLLGAATLSVVYLGVVSLAGGLSHALELFWEDRLFVVPILLGFGAQAALFTRLRLAARRARAEGAMTAAGGGLSTAGMIACCAHHIADLLPILGLSGGRDHAGELEGPFPQCRPGDQFRRDRLGAPEGHTCPTGTECPEPHTCTPFGPRDPAARRGETACRWVLGRDDVRALRRLTAGRTTVRAEVGP